MHEATKTRALWGELEHSILKGKGIDIGCGKDPVNAEVRPFEREHGDANVITQHVSEQFDYVFSAHCLEHMHEPKSALREWWQLVSPGGHLFFIVPEEDLYEQGYWPSLFNPDHKATFTLSDTPSWSPKSQKIKDLVASLPGAHVVSIKLQENGYDRSLLQKSKVPWGWARFWSAVRMKLILTCMALGFKPRLFWLCKLVNAPIDQTANDASAQIQVILKKQT